MDTLTLRDMIAKYDNASVSESVRLAVRTKLDAAASRIGAKNWTCSFLNPFSCLYWLFDKGGDFDFPYQLCGPLTHSGQADRFRQKGRLLGRDDQLLIESFEGMFLTPLKRRIGAEHTFVEREGITRPIRITMAPAVPGDGKAEVYVFFNLATPLDAQLPDQLIVDVILAELHGVGAQLLALANGPRLDNHQGWVLRSTSLQLRNRLERLQPISSSWHATTVMDLFDWIAKVIATDLIKPANSKIRLISCTICRVAASKEDAVDIVGSYFRSGVARLKMAPRAHGIVHNVAHTGQMFYISDVPDYVSQWDERVKSDPSLARGFGTPLPKYVACHPETKSELAVPLMAQGRVVGVINVEADGVNAFDDQHVLTLFQFGSSVALVSRLVSLLGDSKVLAQLHDKINLAKERRDVLQALLEACRSLDHGVPIIWDSKSQEWMPSDVYSSPRRAGGFTKWIAANRDPLVVADIMAGKSRAIEFQVFRKNTGLDGTFFSPTDIAPQFEVKEVAQEIQDLVRNPATPILTGLGFPIASSQHGEADAVLWVNCFREFSTLPEDNMWRISLLCESAAARLRELAERQANRLESLVSTTDELLKTAFSSSTQESLEQICLLAAGLLGAESCAFFVYTKAGGQNLRIRASWCEALGFSTAGLKKDFEEEGMTAQLAKMLALGNEPVRLTQSEYMEQLRLNQLEEVPQSPHPHVKGGVYKSLLAIPLKRKGKLRGYLKFLNKKGGMPFDEVDAAVGRILSSKLSAIYENRLTFDTLIALSKSEPTLRQYNEKVLAHVAHLLFADRAELAIWDEEKRQLVYDAIFGPTTSPAVAVEEEVPKESLIRSLWHSRGEAVRKIDNIASLSGKEYHPAHEATVSEAAIRIDGESLPICVVNVEWFDARSGFDVQDDQILRLVNSTAASMMQQLRGERYFQRIVTEIMTSPEELRDILRKVLENIHAVFGFEEGIIYRHNPEKNELSCLACKSTVLTPEETARFAHSLADDKPSFVSHVFRKAAGVPFAFSPNPWHDLRVSTPGLKHFAIPENTTLVGLQLRHGQRSLGAMIIWSRENAPPQEVHQHRLRVYAELAAARIAMQNSVDQIKESQRFYEGILQELPVKIFRKNADGIFEFVNSAFARGTKFSAKEIIGLNDFHIYDREDAERYRADDDLVRTRRLPISSPELHGGTLVYRIKIPVIGPSGEVIGVLGCFWDLKEEMEREELLRIQLNHHVSAYLKHLSAALGRTNEPTAPNLLEFKETLKRIIHLHDAVFRRDSQQADPQSVVQEIAEAHLALYEMQKNPRKIALSVRISPAPYSVETRKYMPRIFSELVGNSLKYAFHHLEPDEGGTITITSEVLSASNEVKWTYSDDGQEWQPSESGANQPPPRYGMKLVELYAGKLGGRPSFETPGGLQRLIITHPIKLNL